MEPLDECRAEADLRKRCMVVAAYGKALSCTNRAL